MSPEVLANIEQATDWSNLSALGTLMALVLWFAMKGLPSIMEKWETASQTARADFREVVTGLIEDQRSQRAEFREELRLHREMSQDLSNAGHEAMRGLAESVDQLRAEVHATRCEVTHHGDT